MKHKLLSIIFIIVSLSFPEYLSSKSLPIESLTDNTNGIYDGTLKPYFQAQKILDFPKSLEMADKMAALSERRNDTERQLLAQIIREEHSLMTEDADSMKVGVEKIEKLTGSASKFDYSVLLTEKERLAHENTTLELHETKVKEAILWVTLVFLLMIGGSYSLYRRKVLKELNESEKKAVHAKKEAEVARFNAEIAKSHAEQADKLKTLFLQNMSHEIRTPLNAIIGFNELLNNEDTNKEISPEERKQFVQMIQANSDLLLTLVNDILDLSKFESGTYKRIISEANIYGICNTTIESVRSRVAPQVGLILKCDEKDISLRTDEKRLQQLLINFLTNAAKYTSQGYIELAFDVRNGMAVFSVTDTGVGIPKEDRERIFNRFEKLDDFKQGTGLGLNICKCISEMLEGKIYIDPDYDDGARFVFEHPLTL